MTSQGIEIRGEACEEEACECQCVMQRFICWCHGIRLIIRRTLKRVRIAAVVMNVAISWMRKLRCDRQMLPICWRG